MKGEKSNFRVRRRMVAGAWCAAVVLLGWQSFDVQVMETDRWRALAAGQHRTSSEVAAPRGRILDRAGRELAASREVFSVAVAPREVGDADHVAGRVATHLPISFEDARRATAAERRWVVFPGRYGPEVKEALEGLPGIYVEREKERVYPRERLVRGVLGAVVDGRGAGGVEQVHDEILSGEPGSRVVARASNGDPLAGESRLVRPPRPGGDVALTLDLELQEMAHHALGGALEETGAEGGDVLVTRPGTGEILAMVSRRSGGEATHLPALTSIHEPGSTLKPFTVAGLLREGLAAMDDEVEVGGGRWTVHGRTITDVETPDTASTLTLRDALRVSSNVGLARMADRLSREEQYEILRDFGFGVPTGLGLPGEAGGVLRRPEEWSRQSPASLAIGYELGATPLQMAMAYGALANGGDLMEPRLVREVRATGGEVKERHEPRRVRNVVSPEVAAEVRGALREVVTDGTGTAADLGVVPVAGKTGTTRAYGPGGYQEGGYQASFIGFLPADDPELLVYLRLDRPEGEYYGGATAAPATRKVMEALVAARDAPVERRALASPAPAGSAAGILAGVEAAPPGSWGAATEAGDGSRASSRFVALEAGAGNDETLRSPAPSGGTEPWGSSNEPGVSNVQLISAPAQNTRAPSDGSAGERRGGSGEGRAGSGEEPPPVEVPDISDHSLRDAVNALHSRGLRAELGDGEGPYATLPEPGSEVSPGDTVVIVGEGHQ